MHAIYFFLALIGAAGPAQRAAPADNGPLEIVSPADGAIVAPGQTLMVRLRSRDNSTFTSAFVIGENGLSSADIVTTMPAQVAVVIPADIECRRYSITALGVTTAGARVSTSIEIDVERPDLPRAISPQLRQLIFAAEGEEGSIDLAARFADGRVLLVRESSHVRYRSSDPAVATVDVNGYVTTIAEGETEIVATYGPPAAGISATIPVSVPPSLLVASPRALDFSSQLVTASSTRRMTLTNQSSGALRITDVSITGDYTQTNTCVASSPLAAGASCSISVTFGPTAGGARVGAVVVATDFHIVPLKFGLTGTGVVR